MRHVEPQLDRLVRTLLREGALLYPYRPSALKNRFRWTIGVLMPPGAGEPTSFHVELLVEGANAIVHPRLRFLHLVERPGPDGGEPWQEGRERDLQVAAHGVTGPPIDYTLPVKATEPGQAPLTLRVGLATRRLGAGAWSFSLRVENVGPAVAPGTPRHEAVLRAAVAAHALLEVEGGVFVSLRDPPPALAAAAREARCDRAWPVLLGTPPRAHEALVSPVIVDEPPALAPESPGDLFDATEMDEMLALRVRTLAPLERDEVAADPLGRELLAAVERADLARLHGARRDPGAGPGPGARVRLRPRRRADVLDLALAGRAATVVAVRPDVDGSTHLVVVLDDDPGRDLGLQGDVPGHRFYVGADEVEVLP